MIELVEIGCVAIAAFVMAFGEALRREPRVWAFVPFRRFFQSRNWRFIPAIFVTLAVIIWLGNQLPKPASTEHQVAQPAPARNETVNHLRKLEYEKQITLGRTSFFNMMTSLSNLPPELKNPPKQFVIISSTPENVVLREDLSALIYLSWNLSRGSLRPLNLPEYDHDRDAPKFEADESPGITIHGSKALADFIERSLSNCFHIGTTTQMPVGAAEYYIQKFPSWISKDDGFTWLEIGRGLPWKNVPCIGPGN